MRRKQRSIYYTCSAIKDSNLVSLQVEAGNRQIATNIFQKQYNIEPEVIFGPFYEKQRTHDPKPPKQKSDQKLKKIQQRHNNVKLNMLNTNHGTYDGWNITYIPVKEEPDKALVFYNSRIDKIKIPKPYKTVIEIKDIIPK